MFFVITSLHVYSQELILQVPIVETNFCIALHNTIKISSSHVIQSYRHPRYDSRTVEALSNDAGQLFNVCLDEYNNNHRDVLAVLSEDQLHSMILTMTPSADSLYRDVAIEDNLSEDALGKCLGVLKKRAILTVSNNSCPEGYAVVRYNSNAALELEFMDISE